MRGKEDSNEDWGLSAGGWLSTILDSGGGGGGGRFGGERLLTLTLPPRLLDRFLWPLSLPRLPKKEPGSSATPPATSHCTSESGDVCRPPPSPPPPPPRLSGLDRSLSIGMEGNSGKEVEFSWSITRASEPTRLCDLVGSSSVTSRSRSRYWLLLVSVPNRSSLLTSRLLAVSAGTSATFEVAPDGGPPEPTVGGGTVWITSGWHGDAAGGCSWGV